MRILIATDLYAPTVNGVATFTANLASELAARGHTVAVAAPSTTKRSHRERQGRVIIYRIASLPLKFYPVRLSPLPGDELAAICRDFRPDVVHSQSVLMIGYTSVLEARRCKIPVVITHHAMADNVFENLRFLLPVKHPFEQMMRLLGRLVSSRAYAVTTPTRTAADILRLNVAADKMHVISNGIDTERFTPGPADTGLRQRFGIPVGQPLVLYVGRTDPEKHLDTLVRAVQQARKSCKLHALVVGTGSALEHLKELATQLGIGEHISFSGQIPHEELPAVYRLGGIFAISSPTETQSIASLEAMASGLPIVAANAGALPELCHDGHNGLLFETDNPASLAAALTTLAARPDKLAEMGATSRRIALEHTLEKTIRQFEELYAALQQA